MVELPYWIVLVGQRFIHALQWLHFYSIHIGVPFFNWITSEGHISVHDPQLLQSLVP